MVVGIIPARYASTRLPAKPLADIGGQSMIQRVYLQCRKANLLDDVWVATDDTRIFDHVAAFGGKAILTQATHQSGTDRCAEAIQLCCPDAKVVINIQGDEPFINPLQIDHLAQLFANPDVQIATLIKAISSHAELFDPSKPKVVVDKNKRAVYFSRHPIPYLRNIAEQTQWHLHHPFYKHIGIYGYRTHTLQQLTQLPIGALEQAESLEQLRWIEHGYQIYTNITEHESLSIDTPEDLEKARAMLDC